MGARSGIFQSLLQEESSFILGQRDIITADGEDRKPLQSTATITVARSWPHSVAFFVDTDGPEWRNKHSDDNLVTVKSIVYHGRSQLYTSFTVAMVIYHSYLHLSV